MAHTLDPEIRSMRALPASPSAFRAAALLLLAAGLGCASTPKAPPAPADCTSVTVGRSRTVIVSPLGELGKKVFPLTCATGKPFAELELFLGDESHARALALKYPTGERVWLAKLPRLDPESPIEWSPGNETENRFNHVYQVKPAGDGRTIRFSKGTLERQEQVVFDLVAGKVVD